MIAIMARAATTSEVFDAITEAQRREILVLLRAGEAPMMFASQAAARPFAVRQRARGSGRRLETRRRYGASSAIRERLGGAEIRA
jgi:hypothetical protein